MHGIYCGLSLSMIDCQSIHNFHTNRKTYANKNYSIRSMQTINVLPVGECFLNSFFNYKNKNKNPKLHT